MLQATLSIQGLYDYDPTVLELLVLPEGIDRTVLINNLIIQAGAFELVYTSFPILRQYVGDWSKRRLPVWQKLYNTTVLDYNPIENYNRHEIWHDTGKGTNERSDTSTVTNTQQGSAHQEQSDNGNGTSTSTSTSTNDDLRKKWGFNLETPANAEENIITANGNNKTDNSFNSGSNVNQSSSNTVNTTHGGKINDKNTNDSWHDGHLYGNIGVTTTQQMIEQERKIAEFDVMKYIILDFIQEFCVMVY